MIDDNENCYNYDDYHENFFKAWNCAALDEAWKIVKMKRCFLRNDKTFIEWQKEKPEKIDPSTLIPLVTAICNGGQDILVVLKDIMYLK